MKLSIITSGRNDNYGGDFAGRTILTANRTQAEAKRHGVEIEQIFIEWNPPKDTPYLSLKLANLGCKCYVVSPEIHNRTVHPSVGGRMVMMQFFACNVGIRRATMPWILSTTPDTIHGPDVWQFLASEKMYGDVLYRAHRHDVPLNWYGKSFDEMQKHSTLDHGGGPTNAAGDFLLFNAKRRKGFDEAINFSDIHGDGRFVRDWIAKLGARWPDGKFWHGIGTVYKADHPRIYRRTVNEAAHHRGRKSWNSKAKTCKCAGLYRNPPNWGLADVQEKQIAERIWYLG